MSNVCNVCQKEATKACSACSLVFYCCKEHQKEDWKEHKNSCVCYKVRNEEVLGRCVTASRNIQPGEVIMRSEALVLGPKIVSPPLCLGCHKKLDLEKERYDCRRCRWPLCNEKCEKALLHEGECEVFAKACYKPGVRNDNGKQSVYSSIAPLRALLLKEKEPEKFALLLTCQSHLDQHLDTPVYQIIKRNLVPFFINVLKLDTNEIEILTICSIFDTNCFEVRDPQGQVNIRGLYPKVTFLSHDCKHNTKHSFHGDSFQILLTSTVPIKKGHLITTTYTQTLWGTLERRSHLKMSKLFDCVCERCKDPTEFGTFVGSTNCNQCGEGKIVSCDALDARADWRCTRCGFEVTGEEIVWGNETLKREIASLDKRSPENLEEFLLKYGGVLHEKNSYSLQVKYALTQMYASMDDLSDELADRQVILCRELLEVAQVLEPGHSRFRGYLLYDLHEALMTKIKRGEKGLELDARRYLKEAEEILRTEPDLGDVVREKMQKLLI